MSITYRSGSALAGFIRKEAKRRAFDMFGKLLKGMRPHSGNIKGMQQYVSGKRFRKLFPQLNPKQQQQFMKEYGTVNTGKTQYVFDPKTYSYSVPSRQVGTMGRPVRNTKKVFRKRKTREGAEEYRPGKELGQEAGKGAPGAKSRAGTDKPFVPPNPVDLPDDQVVKNVRARVKADSKSTGIFDNKTDSVLEDTVSGLEEKGSPIATWFGDVQPGTLGHRYMTRFQKDPLSTLGLTGVGMYGATSLADSLLGKQSEAVLKQIKFINGFKSKGDGHG